VAAGGLNRYGYVGGNPETASDPSGHACMMVDVQGGSLSCGGGTRGALSGGMYVTTASQASMAARGVFLSLVVSAGAAMLGAWLGSLGNPVGRFSRTR
jgi:hypothetical protein